MLKRSNRETPQPLLWQTEWWPSLVWWICDTAAQGPRDWLLGCGLAIMVCLITCAATQQVISQTGTWGLTCHQEINNPSTRSGYLRGMRTHSHWLRWGRGVCGTVLFRRYMFKMLELYLSGYLSCEVSSEPAFALLLKQDCGHWCWAATTNMSSSKMWLRLKYGLPISTHVSSDKLDGFSGASWGIYQVCAKWCHTCCFINYGFWVKLVERQTAKETYTMVEKTADLDGKTCLK